MQRIAKSIAAMALLFALAAPSASALTPDYIKDFKADVWKDDPGTHVQTQAGSTPKTGITAFDIKTNMLGQTPEQLKRIRVDLPPGLISNPAATPLCSQADFTADSCDPKSQVGEVTLTASNVTPTPSKVFNLEPAAGQVSDFAFKASFAGIPTPLITHIIGGVRDTTDFGLFFTIDVPQLPPPGLNLSHSELKFFGNPGDADWGTGADDAPFIRLPTACAGPQTTMLTVDTYEGNTYATSVGTKDDFGQPIGATGCDKVPFAPTLSVIPSSTQRDAPVGAAVNIGVPWQNTPNTSPDDVTHLASAHVKNTVVTLPPGMTISPSAANGLQACTDDQFGQGTHNAITCPDGSKVGTATIETPVLPGANPGEGAKLTGNVYLGQPLADNPYRLFVDAESAKYGVVVRLKGTVTPDPVTGQLKTTFADTPQVPFTNFSLNLNPGPNATLASPLACGTATTTSAITPYSGNADAAPSSAYTVDLDGNGGQCPPTPFNLGFSAGTSNPLAGAFTPFSLTITRDDGQQFLSGLTVTQPPGLLGVIQSVPLCQNVLALSGACPEESRVGTSTVSSGPGPAPFTLSGPVYLAGPYGGGPFSLVIAIHALAGPFDLGTVVVRAPIKVDPTDSHLAIDTPSLPTILQGIPLRLRSVNVTIDRSNFLFNATNCDQHAVGARLVSTDGATQDVSAPYKPTGCESLPYAPKMTATTNAAQRGAPAGLTVNLSQSRGEANTKSVSVKLPNQLGARLSTINLACPEDTFKANPKTCAAGSKVGTVSAVTPLLAQPLTGTVYLEAHKPPSLPTLEAVLEGSGITVDLSGKLNLSNGITSTFDTVPDVPITAFSLSLPPSASNSALQATADLCAATLPLVATINGQNGKKVSVNSAVEVIGCGFAITKASVKKRTATLSLRVPAPGAVKVTGKGLKTVKKSFAKAGTYTVKTKLTKKGVKSLKRALRAKKKSKRKLVLKVAASYAPKKGSTVGGEPVKAGKASKKLTFRK
jgi:hypothetical protein